MAHAESAPPTFRLQVHGIQATGQPVDGGFLVLKGSEARSYSNSTLRPEQQALKDRLLTEGHLVATGVDNRLVFAEDTLFPTASDATVTVLHVATPASSGWSRMLSDGREETYGSWRQMNAGNATDPDAARLSAVATWLKTQQKNLENNERTYKLSGAQDIHMGLNVALSGDAPDKLNVQPGNKLNLLGWRTAGGMNALVNRNPQVFREALVALRRNPVRSVQADDFWAQLEPLTADLPEMDRRPLAGTGTRASIASYFLFLADPEGHPFYRPSFGGHAVAWLYGGRPLDDRSPGHLLQEYVIRCEALLQAFQAQGVPLKDMLDLQGALYILSRQYLEGPGGTASATPLLRAVYEAFRADPVQALRCDVRLTRAAHLREQLRHPDTVTLAAFNRDVWRFEADATLGGVGVKGEVYSDQLTPERAAELAAALHEDRLDLHGNYCWGSATIVYGAQLKLADEEKQDLVRQALRVLNDETLTPAQKAEQVDALPGFGPNIATGLTMLFHSDAFALNNRPARDALQALGFDVSTPEAFQTSAQALKDQVGAETFPELDWFLYTRPVHTGYWWVNQGSTYAEEMAHGYVWASKEGGRNIPHHENVARLKPGDRLLHYAGQTIRAKGIVISPPIEVDDEVQSATIPTKRFGLLAQVEYTPLPSPVPIGSLEQEWRTAENGPFDKNGTVRMGYLFPASQALFQRVANTAQLGTVTPPAAEDTYKPVAFPEIETRVQASGLRLDPRTLRRYHLALQTRGFVILSGVSGTGKTWLAEEYARAADAKASVFPVAPNWTSNEDLLGFYSPLDGGHYHHTAFSRFLLEAGEEYRAAKEAGQTPRPYHLILDEMNLARVEYYFAQFLSRMELRARGQETELTLGPDQKVFLGPNIFVIGTVNIDETTHDFADKVYDRAQLIELTVVRKDLAEHLAGHTQSDLLLRLWDVIQPAAPFAFRVMDEITAYLQAAAALGVDPLEALDDAVLHKILPKLRGMDVRMLGALNDFVALAEGTLPLSHAKATRMRDAGTQHGFVSFH